MHYACTVRELQNQFHSDVSNDDMNEMRENNLWKRIHTWFMFYFFIVIIIFFLFNFLDWLLVYPKLFSVHKPCGSRNKMKENLKLELYINVWRWQLSKMYASDIGTKWMCAWGVCSFWIATVKKKIWTINLTIYGHNSHHCTAGRCIDCWRVQCCVLLSNQLSLTVEGMEVDYFAVRVRPPSAGASERVDQGDRRQFVHYARADPVLWRAHSDQAALSVA
jgi:hypothetical protein